MIERLCGKEEVPPQDVVVLSSHGFDNSEVAQLAARQATGWSTKRDKLGNHVFFSSIRGFKGLESKVVILCELEDIDDETPGRAALRRDVAGEQPLRARRPQACSDCQIAPRRSTYSLREVSAE